MGRRRLTGSLLRVFTRAGALAAVLAAAALAGCTSTTNGHSSAAGATTAGTTGAPPASSSSGALSPSSATGSNSAAGLAAQLQAGVNSLNSARITVDLTAAGQVIHGAGVEKVTQGRVDALDLTEQVPGVGQLRILIVDGRTYAQLPGSLNPTGKPWVVVSPDSSIPTVRTLASSISSAQQSASLSTFTTLTNAATSIDVRGLDTVDGVATTHYSIVVDITKLPTGVLSQQQLASTGLRTVPVELWIDALGRPVKVSEAVTVQNVTTSSVFHVGEFNRPVSIAAPPAGEIATS